MSEATETVSEPPAVVAPVSEPEDPRLVSARRRMRRPAWLDAKTILIWSGIFAFFGYAIAYEFSTSFLDHFGTTPEEVGLTQPALVIREAIFGIIGMAIVLVMATVLVVVAGTVIGFTVFLGVITWETLREILSTPFTGTSSLLRRDRSKRKSKSRRPEIQRAPAIQKTELGKLTRRRLLLISIAGVALAALEMLLMEIDGPNPYQTFDLVSLGIALALFEGAVIYWLAVWRRWIALAVLCVSMLALLLTVANSFGSISARTVASRGHWYLDSGSVYLPLSRVGLQADWVTATGIGGKALVGVPAHLLLVGHGDGLYLLSDCTHLYRLPIGQLQLTYDDANTPHC